MDIFNLDFTSLYPTVRETSPTSFSAAHVAPSSLGPQLYFGYQVRTYSSLNQLQQQPTKNLNPNEPDPELDDLETNKL